MGEEGFSNFWINSKWKKVLMNMDRKVNGLKVMNVYCIF